jgi:hypothetical protein
MAGRRRLAWRRPRAAAAGAAGGCLLAGCTSAQAPVPAPAPSAATAPLATSLAQAGGRAWAIVAMGGSAADDNSFWEVFTRPLGSSQWALVTPPGVADNGGLVVASAGGRSLITGFRPSQGLTYTPLTQTRDGGQAWSSIGPLDAPLANVPDALAAAPGSGNLLALQADGTASVAAPGYTRWATLASPRSLAATPAGRRCGLRSITAAAYSSAGQPLLAGTCSRPGIVGIFTDTGGTWQPAAPGVPAALIRQPVTVLRLTTTTNQTVALLTAGTGHAASLLAAWSADSGRHWTVSPPLRLGGAALASAAFGSTGTVALITSSGTAAVITSAGAWHPLPALPAGTATLAPGPAGQADALAVHRGTLTIWQLPSGGSTWTKTQVINVPIQYGSSG